MQLPAAELTPAVLRLRRARGQLDAVLRMIEEGRDCADVVTQLAAVSKAVDRAGFAIIATGMQHCVVDGGENAELTDDERQARFAQMERLFMSLS